MVQAGDQYLAGLWRSSFLSDISWWASDKDLDSDGIKKNRRPLPGELLAGRGRQTK